MQTLKGVLVKGPKGRLDTTCKIVLHAWYNNTYVPTLDKPNHFLYRIVQHWKEKGDEDKGILRATHCFIAFLRLIWLAHMAIATNTLEPLFIPSYFFRHKHEVLAFKQYMLNQLKEKD